MAASTARPLSRRRCAVQGEIADALGPAGRDHAHRRHESHTVACGRAGGTQRRLNVPWALRARNLTYVGELPFVYTSETDRYLVFADLLFDALAPRTPERHRALLRLEDINPRTDPKALRTIANYLHDEESHSGSSQPLLP